MKLLGIEYDNLTVKEALEAIIGLIEARQKANVFFLNADCLYKAQKDQEYRKVLKAASLLLSDGIGLRLATRIFGGSMRGNCNGTDLSPQILEEAAKRNWKVFFLGGKDGVAKKAAENIQLKLPALNVVGAGSGYFENDKEVINIINDAAPDIVFVAMGAPLQEKWIFRNRAFINTRLCLGVGAFLDYLSGDIPRAPQWMRQGHIEWLWRIFIDPKRMFKRYVIDGFCFMIYVLYIRLMGKKLR
jgi:N-acetylglucosaminyldiphosphoundecaprenol N-acetyl-beta-D-mannosaminyltransferase